MLYLNNVIMDVDRYFDNEFVFYLLVTIKMKFSIVNYQGIK